MKIITIGCNIFPVLLQLLSTLIETFGMHGTMLLFSLNSLIIGIYVVCVLPETKGKTYEEIKKIMEQ